MLLNPFQAVHFVAQSSNASQTTPALIRLCAVTPSSTAQMDLMKLVAVSIQLTSFIHLLLTYEVNCIFLKNANE